MLGELQNLSYNSIVWECFVLDRVYNEDWLSKLKEKADIVSIISSYIPLNRKGNIFWGNCPFHHEKTPSFAVNPAGQFYHCFGCGESGDVIKFVQKYESVEFMEACHILAEKVGFEIPEKTQNGDFKEKKNEKEQIYQVLKDTAYFYHNNLKKSDAKPALDYLASRGFDNKIITAFGLGCSIDYNGLPQYLKLKNYTDDIIIKSGVCMRNERGELYDCLGGRLIIPIINSQSKVIAFGGRILTTAKVNNKYKNTNNTSVFIKNRNLFAINNLHKLKQREKVDSVIMVEGYMDVISLYKSGIYNVVASMGTSLTDGQASLVKRYCDKVYVAYDGDTAGQMATLRSLDIFASKGLEVKVIQLDKGLDPDEIIKEKGKKYFLDLVVGAKPLIDYKLLQIESKYDLTTPDSRAKFATEAIAMLREIKEVEVREVYLNEVCKKSQIQKYRLQQQMDSDTQPETVSIVKEDLKYEKNIGYLKACRIVLLAMLNNKPYAPFVDISRYLTDSTHQDIFTYIKEQNNNNKLNVIGDLFTIIPENEELKEVLSASIKDNEEWENAEYKESLETLKKYYIQEQIAVTRSKILSTIDIGEKRELLSSLKELQNELKDFNGVR